MSIADLSLISKGILQLKYKLTDYSKRRSKGSLFNSYYMEG